MPFSYQVKNLQVKELGGNIFNTDIVRGGRN